MWMLRISSAMILYSYIQSINTVGKFDETFKFKFNLVGGKYLKVGELRRIK